MIPTHVQAKPGYHGHQHQKDMSVPPKDGGHRMLIKLTIDMDKELYNPVQDIIPVHGHHLIISRSQHQLMVDSPTNIISLLEYVIQITIRKHIHQNAG